MIRSKVVVMKERKMIAYRKKLQAGDSGIVLMSPETTAVGLAVLSKRTREPIPSDNTDLKIYPLEAFAEAADLTAGMPYHKLGNVKVSKDMFVEEVKEEKEEEVSVNLEDYEKIVSLYSDKNGKLSYGLLNKDFIQFAHRSSIVRNMIQNSVSANEIRDYIVSNKIRNIVNDPNLSDAQVAKMVEWLDEVSPKGVFRDLNEEIRRLLTKKKK